MDAGEQGKVAAALQQQHAAAAAAAAAAWGVPMGLNVPMPMHLMPQQPQPQPPQLQQQHWMLANPGGGGHAHVMPTQTQPGPHQMPVHVPLPMHVPHQLHNVNPFMVSAMPPPPPTPHVLNMSMSGMMQAGPAAWGMPPQPPLPALPPMQWAIPPHVLQPPSATTSIAMPDATTAMAHLRPPMMGHMPMQMMMQVPADYAPPPLPSSTMVTSSPHSTSSHRLKRNRPSSGTAQLPGGAPMVRMDTHASTTSSQSARSARSGALDGGGGDEDVDVDADVDVDEGDDGQPEAHDDEYGDGAYRPSPSTSSALNRPISDPSQGGKYRTGKWSVEEHSRFLEALDKYGTRDWSRVTEHVGTRSAVQVRSHAQKCEESLRRSRKKKKAGGMWWPRYLAEGTQDAPAHAAGAAPGPESVGDGGGEEEKRARVDLGPGDEAAAVPSACGIERVEKATVEDVVDAKNNQEATDDTTAAVAAAATTTESPTTSSTPSAPPTTTTSSETVATTTTTSTTTTTVPEEAEAPQQPQPQASSRPTENDS